MQKRSRQLTQKKKRAMLEFYMRNYADRVSFDFLSKLRSLDTEKKELVLSALT